MHKNKLEMAYRLKCKARHHCLQEENIGKTFRYQPYECFLRSVSQRTEIKAKINQCDLITLTSFCIAKETKKKTRRQLTECEKIVSNYETVNSLIPKK